MDYKIKYLDALEGIRELYNSDCDMIRVKRLKRRLEHIFPELAKSEDEKIREALKQGFFEYGNSFTTFGGIQVGDIIAWLEKQGKQNPVEWSEEDEKIKESIKKVLANTNFNKLGIKYSFYEMISWLDKQGEQKSNSQMEKCSKCQFVYTGYCDGTCILENNDQKPADKIEPKFKPGDWV